MNQTDLAVNVTVIVENLEEVKHVVKETEDLLVLLQCNLRKLEQMGLQYQVKANKG